MVTDVRLLQLLKVLDQIVLILLGMVTEVRELHQEKVLLVDYQYYTL